MIIEGLQALSEIRERHKNQKIVYCGGAFDLTHAGHVLFLEDCRKYGDVLVVTVGPDQDFKKLRGPGKPILNEKIRLKMIDSLKPVDYAFVGIAGVDQYDNPLAPIRKYFETLKPDVYVVNEDAFDIPYRREMVGDYNIELVVLERKCPPEFENISTSKIIEKIKNS